MNGQYVLDACCGSRMFYFEKHSPHVLFMDCRKGDFVLTNGKTVSIQPDIQASFEHMPFESESFRMVVFDPPHVYSHGKGSDMEKTYGCLTRGWQQIIRNGFRECFRVLEPHGILLFKWCEARIKLSSVLELAPYGPLLGTRTKVPTAFIVFLKEELYKK